MGPLVPLPFVSRNSHKTFELLNVDTAYCGVRLYTKAPVTFSDYQFIYFPRLHINIKYVGVAYGVSKLGI